MSSPTGPQTPNVIPRSARESRSSQALRTDLRANSVPTPLPGFLGSHAPSARQQAKPSWAGHGVFALNFTGRFCLLLDPASAWDKVQEQNPLGQDPDPGNRHRLAACGWTATARAGGPGLRWVRGTVARRSRAARFMHVVRYGRTSIQARFRFRIRFGPRGSGERAWAALRDAPPWGRSQQTAACRSHRPRARSRAPPKGPTRPRARSRAQPLKGPACTALGSPGAEARRPSRRGRPANPVGEADRFQPVSETIASVRSVGGPVASSRSVRCSLLPTSRRAGWSPPTHQ